MTPDITPFLLEADRRKPHLKTINTAHSCFELLQLALSLAGPDWAFIGKVAGMDGGKVTPPGFTPIDMELKRPDGQAQRVLVAGVSMDAAWHMPSQRQVKVIANSCANDDPDPKIHGPAKLTPYGIDAAHYRWHNPAVPQSLVPGGSVTPMPQPTPPAPHVGGIKERGQFFRELTEVNDFYRSPAGLNRPGGMMKTDDQGRPIADVEALGKWGYDLLTGKSPADCIREIRSIPGGEWQQKHPGETP